MRSLVGKGRNQCATESHWYDILHEVRPPYPRQTVNKEQRPVGCMSPGLLSEASEDPSYRIREARRVDRVVRVLVRADLLIN